MQRLKHLENNGGGAMASPRKINSKFWVHYYRRFRGKSIRWIADKYNVSKRTVWRYLK